MSKLTGNMKSEKSTNYKVKRENTHRCAYRVGEEQCFNAGANTSAPKPDDNTKWYCIGHLESLEGNNPAHGEHVLYESRLAKPEPDWLEEMMQERLKAEPYAKLDGETSKQYGARMMETAKRNARNIGKL